MGGTEIDTARAATVAASYRIDSSIIFAAAAFSDVELKCDTAAAAAAEASLRSTRMLCCGMPAAGQSATLQRTTNDKFSKSICLPDFTRLLTVRWHLPGGGAGDMSWSLNFEVWH